MARQRFSDEDDDRDDRPRDDRPRDEDEDRPRPRRQRDDDEYDDRRGPLKKPGLATAAGVLWVIWGALGCIMLILNVLSLMSDRRAAAGGSTGLAEVVGLLLMIGGIVICLVGGIRTLNGSASSIRAFGLISLIYSIGYVLLTTALAAYVATQMGAVAGAPGAGLGAFVLIIACVVTVLIMSGMILASIFAMSSSKKYELWWRATKGRSRGDD